MNAYLSAIEALNHQTGSSCHASWSNGKLVLEIDPECELFSVLTQLASEAEPSAVTGDPPKPRLSGRKNEFRFEPTNRIASYRCVAIDPSLRSLSPPRKRCSP